MAAACTECKGQFASVPCSKCDPAFRGKPFVGSVVPEPEVVEEPVTEGESVDDEAGQDAE